MMIKMMEMVTAEQGKSWERPKAAVPLARRQTRQASRLLVAPSHPLGPIYTINQSLTVLPERHHLRPLVRNAFISFLCSPHSFSLLMWTPMRLPVMHPRWLTLSFLWCAVPFCTMDPAFQPLRYSSPDVLHKESAFQYHYLPELTPTLALRSLAFPQP